MFNRISNKTVKKEAAHLYNSVVLFDLWSLISPLLLDFFIVYLCIGVSALFFIRYDLLPGCSLNCFGDGAPEQCCSFSLATVSLLLVLLLAATIGSFLTLKLKKGERFKRSAYLTASLMIVSLVFFLLRAHLSLLLILLFLTALFFLSFVAYRLSLSK